MSAGETDQHRELKALALRWLQENGSPIAATEVGLPNVRCRFDVAGYKPARAAASPEPALGHTTVIECKQSRADFLRDTCWRDTVLAQLARLHERKAEWERHLQVHCPWLGNGDSLFSEYVSYDFRRLGHEAYEKTLVRIRQFSHRLHSQTKFDDLQRWRSANLYYIAATPGVVRPHELPFGWGLLVAGRQGLEVELKPVWHEIPAARRLLLLQRIAMAGTRAVKRAAGVPSGPAGRACGAQTPPVASTLSS